MVARRATPLLAATLGAAALVAVPGASGAEGDTKQKPISASPLLWATVNVCDTVDNPDTIGIRASMPGSGIRSEKMFMRFRVQFFAKADGKWHNVGKAGDSGFRSVGSARFAQRQSGRNFTIEPPTDGAYRLRGAVTFQWREGDKVIRSASKRTTGGRGRTRGADPKGFSAASCVVR